MTCPPIPPPNPDIGIALTPSIYQISERPVCMKPRNVNGCAFAANFSLRARAAQIQDFSFGLLDEAARAALALVAGVLNHPTCW